MQISKILLDILIDILRYTTYINMYIIFLYITHNIYLILNIYFSRI